jgi:hypothetical protein
MRQGQSRIDLSTVSARAIWREIASKNCLLDI